MVHTHNDMHNGCMQSTAAMTDSGGHKYLRIINSEGPSRSDRLEGAAGEQQRQEE